MDEKRQIVVGVDGSNGSAAALRWAARQAEAMGAELEAVLAYSFGLAWADVGSNLEPAFVESATRNATETLHRAVAEALPEPRAVTVHQLVVEGNPAEVLLEIAHDADLLVVGTRGRGGFAGLLLGSVSQRCAEHAHCPVVVVP
jgi:nucleotide-binding universal stress UspA family protein